MSKLNVVPYHFDRDTEVISLLNRVFSPWIGDNEYFTWKYSNLETDESDFPLAWIIEKQGKIIAFNGYRTRPLWLGNRRFWVAQSFDTVTEPDCRGQGLFGILQNSVYEEMKNRNIAWVYGWTSDIGFKVFTKKAGWEVWGNQRFLMKVINAKKYVGQKIRNPFLQFAPYLALSAFGKILKPKGSPNIVIKEENLLPESAGTICEKVCKNFGMIATRDVSYLNWRFSNPQSISRMLCAYQNQEPCGYAVISEKDNYLHIDDCLAGSPDIMSGLLAEIEDIAKNHGKEIIRFRVNEKHPWSYIFMKAGYFWSDTSFPMLGKKLAEDDDFSFDKSNLHWTLFDRNE